MKIESLIIEDVEFISTLQPEGWDNILPKVRFYAESDYCFPIKILHNKKIAGIGATIIHNDTAWLGHIIVHEKERGKGIGRLITEKLIEIAKAKNCKTIHLIATDLGAPVYEKAGFVTQTDYLFFENVQIGSVAIDYESIYKYKPAYKNMLLEIDKFNSTEERSCELEGHLENAFIYLYKDKVEGFYLPTLGEGLIIANNQQAGIELLKLHLKSHNKVVLPKDNHTGTSFLYEHGFKEYSKAKRMTLGENRNVQFENIYNRIGGYIG